MKQQNSMILIMILLLLGACGQKSAPQMNTTGVVTLVGVVSSQSNLGNNGVYSNTMVVSSDKNGNSKTVKVDKTGSFSITLDTGIDHSLTFIDEKTYQVIGSLVKANNQNKAATVKLTGNDNLGDVILNPKRGIAVSSKEQLGFLVNSQVNQAPLGMDVNSDGKITNVDMSSNQATTASTNPTALTYINLLDYFAKPNTWGKSTTHFVSNTPTNVVRDTSTLWVASPIRLSGAHGKMIDAVKSSALMYYNKFSDIYSNTQLGFFDNNGGYTKGSYLSPMVYDYWTGPVTWATADYVDSINNQIWNLNDIGNSKAVWSKSLPLNVTLGQPFTINSKDANGSLSIVFTVTMAKENGKPYVFTDISNQKHPVIMIDEKTTFTPSPNSTICKVGGLCQPKINQSGFYIVRGYGIVTANAIDAKGMMVTPSIALAKIDFGDIGTTITQLNKSQNMASAGYLTAIQRDQILNHLWSSKDKIGFSAKKDSTKIVPKPVQIKEYFSINYDAYSQSVQPASWNPSTYKMTVLQSGTTKNFTTSIQYGNNQNASKFTYEFRTYNALGVTTVLTSSNVISVPPSKGIDTLIPVKSMNLAIPLMSQLPAIDKYNYIDPATKQTVTEGWIELWLVMKDINGKLVKEEPLDSYVIQ